MNSLDEYAFSGSLSSRSSTPAVAEPHHSYNMSHSTTSGSLMFLGAEEWISSSPASDPAPLTSLTPNPFRYNQQKAPSFHPDCRQCAALKRENLVLATENATLKHAYDALLAVVGPAVFLGQAPGASDGGDLAASGSRLGLVPSTPILQRSDHPRVEFWHFHEYKNHLELTKGESNTDDPKPRGSSRAAQGINVTMRYVQDADGVTIDGFRATAIRGLATKLFVMAEASGVAPPTWNKGSLEFQSKFSAEICQKFPEMGLCANDWKVQHMATKMYSSWYRGRNNSQIKSEAPEDDLTPSKGIKRNQPNQPNQPLKTAASKKVKLSETPPPLERDEQNKHDQRYFAVVVPSSTMPTPRPEEHETDKGAMPLPDDPPVNAEGSNTRKEPATEVVAFKIINPLLSAVPQTAASPAGDIQAPNPLPSATPAPTTMTPVQQASAATPTGTAPSGTVEVHPAPAAKGKKATPGASKTPRNLCMIDWCKKHPGGYLSDFKIYWTSIEKTSDSDQYREASANAAASKTKAAS
ncbi:hypothetical protein MVEN_00669400 [Mycena venus]|uniref:Uncharacterized protein n=1 Tax=Mycena venus TaxID=2733690 RepID=A0A8H6YRE7_9AGAR|nr:hypothetical protein MVEN_00669400 [Mycena venus]